MRFTTILLAAALLWGCARSDGAERLCERDSDCRYMPGAMPLDVCDRGTCADGLGAELTFSRFELYVHDPGNTLFDDDRASFGGTSVVEPYLTVEVDGELRFRAEPQGETVEPAWYDAELTIAVSDPIRLRVIAYERDADGDDDVLGRYTWDSAASLLFGFEDGERQAVTLRAPPDVDYFSAADVTLAMRVTRTLPAER